jgi:hypothetical protein
MLQKMKTLPGVKNLTRAEQKMVIGGQSCTMTYQDASGNWRTEKGNCELAYLGQGIGGSGIYQNYCKTDSFPGPVPLSSNGGASRCGSQTGSQTTLLGILFG